MSNGIQQSLETLGNLGNTFINSFSAGMQISQSLEKNKRERRQSGLNLLKQTQKTLNDIFTTQGADAANQYMQTEAYQEAVQQLKNVGFDADLTPTGSFQKQVDYNTALEIYMENTNLTEEQAKKRLKDNGISEGNLITFDMNYNNTSELNLQKTQESFKQTLDIKKKIQDLEKDKMQISQSLEKNRREKRQTSLNLLKETQKTLNDIFTTQGAEAVNQYMKTEVYQKAVQQLKNVGFNAELTPTGVFQKQVPYDTGVKIFMKNNNLTEKQVKKRLKDNGISEGTLITFDINYNNRSELNLKKTQESSKQTLDIKKKIQDLEKTVTNVTAKGYPKNINALVKVANDYGNLLNTPKEIIEFKKLVNSIYPGYYEDIETTLNVGSNQLGTNQLKFDAQGNRIDNAN